MRWRVAGMLRKVPEFRGRDRLGSIILGKAPPPAGIHSGSFGPGLRYEARYGDDGSLRDLFFLQYEAPSLVPVLEELLEQGDIFFDVGANIGIYSGWASRTVGPSGSVHAFEPIPSTREMLVRFIALNGLDNVTIVPMGLGGRKGTLELHVPVGASGLASAVRNRGKGDATVSVAMTSIDDHVTESGCGIPRLIKIDVEGFEFEVIRGAREVLAASRPPAMLFESQEAHLREAGATMSDIVRWFEVEAGFHVYAMLPRGLVRLHESIPAPLSTNSLALHPAAHAAAYRSLRRERFRRNQTC